MSRIKNRKEEGTSENDVEKQMADSKTALRLAHEFDQSDTVLSIALSQDGTKLAAGGYDNKVTLYDLKTKSIFHTFDRSNVINTVALSQDGTKLAAGGSDKKVTLYDLKTKFILHILITVMWLIQLYSRKMERNLQQVVMTRK